MCSLFPLACTVICVCACVRLSPECPAPAAPVCLSVPERGCRRDSAAGIIYQHHRIRWQHRGLSRVLSLDYNSHPLIVTKRSC